MLHAALRQVLGTHVAQKGSLVNDKYLRFDFSHFEAMKPEEIRAVEDMVNAQIRRNLPIETNIMDLEAAKAKGAMALFGEKYDDIVRVSEHGRFLNRTVWRNSRQPYRRYWPVPYRAESGTAAGVRRIEAVTGEGAMAMHCMQQSDQLQDVAQLVKGDSQQSDGKSVR